MTQKRPAPADTPLEQRRSVRAANEAEIRAGILRRHFEVAEERQLIARLRRDHALAEASTLAALTKQEQRD